VKRFSDWISRMANGRVVIAFSVFLLFFNFGVLPFSAKQLGPGQGQPILDLMFGFSPEQAYTIIAAYGDAGRSGAILTTATADSLYPFVYAGLLAMAISWFMNGIPFKNPKWQYLNLLPFVALVFDFVENAGIITMLAGYPEQFVNIARMASVAGMLKWTFVGVSLLALVLVIFWGRISPFFFRNENIRQNLGS
jgi:hypothetical protein